MKLIAAYLLLSLANENPSAEDITKLLSTVGIEADSERLEKLMSELSGKDINALIAEGQEKLASVPSGGAVAAAPAAGGAAACVWNGPSGRRRAVGRPGHRHRPPGDAADQLAVHPRCDPVPAYAPAGLIARAGASNVGCRVTLGQPAVR